MNAPFTSLKDATLTAEAGEHNITDMMFDPTRLTVDYAVVDGSGWLTNTDVLIHASRLNRFDPEDQVWTADLDDSDLADAPRIGPDNVVDLSALPPVIVGPFGMTYSPILMAAQMLGFPVTKDRPARDRIDQLERMSDWMGAVVFSSEGPIARIVNLYVDLETHRVVEVKLAIGADTHVLPITAIRSFISGDGYAVCDLTEAEIKQGFTAAEPGPVLHQATRYAWVQSAA